MLKHENKYHIILKEPEHLRGETAWDVMKECCFSLEADEGSLIFKISMHLSLWFKNNNKYSVSTHYHCVPGTISNALQMTSLNAQSNNLFR